jgi:hypothetical protein
MHLGTLLFYALLLLEMSTGIANLVSIFLLQLIDTIDAG